MNEFIQRILASDLVCGWIDVQNNAKEWYRMVTCPYGGEGVRSWATDWFNGMVISCEIYNGV